MGELKSLRIERKLTQNQAADILGVSLRSYKSYENDEKKADSIKYKYMLEKISEINPIDEENGIVDIDYIKRKCSVVFDKYNVNFCYLFVCCLFRKSKKRNIGNPRRDSNGRSRKKPCTLTRLTLGPSYNEPFIFCLHPINPKKCA